MLDTLEDAISRRRGDKRIDSDTSYFSYWCLRTAREAEGAYLSYLQAEEKIDFNSYLTKLGLEESDHEAITTRVYDDDEEWERFENIFPHQLVVHELDELFDFRNWDYWNYSDLYLLLNALHERRFGDLWPRTMGLERKKQ